MKACWIIPEILSENFKMNLLISFQVNMNTAMLPDPNIIYMRSIRPDLLKVFSCQCSKPSPKNRSSLPFCFFHYSSKHIRLMQQPQCANTCYLQKVILFLVFYIFMFYCILCVICFGALLMDLTNREKHSFVSTSN